MNNFVASFARKNEAKLNLNVIFCDIPLYMYIFSLKIITHKKKMLNLEINIK